MAIRTLSTAVSWNPPVDGPPDVALPVADNEVLVGNTNARRERHGLTDRGRALEAEEIQVRGGGQHGQPGAEPTGLSVGFRAQQRACRAGFHFLHDRLLTLYEDLFAL